MKRTPAYIGALLLIACSAPVSGNDPGPCGPWAHLYQGNCVENGAAKVECPKEDSTLLGDIQTWKYTGTTVYSPEEQALWITTATKQQAGSAFRTEATQRGNDINITFEFKIDGGDGADGFALVALDSSRRQDNLLGTTGCGMGFGGYFCPPQSAAEPLPGWAVEFDTFFNAEVDQTREPHVAFAINGDLANEPFWASVPDLRGNWHRMSVTVSGHTVRAFIDGKRYLYGTVPQNLDFPAWVGFTGSTGEFTDNHFIRGLAVTSAACGH